MPAARRPNPRRRQARNGSLRVSMVSWKDRVSLFAQRFWQPAIACMTCMPGGLEKALSPGHWTLALQTGLVTALLAVLLSFTPVARLYRHRFGNALLIGMLTAFGDAYSHADHYGLGAFEPVVTGLVSAALALAASYLLEDRARRLRALSLLRRLRP